MVSTKVSFRIMGKGLDSSEMTALLLMHPDRFHRKCIRVGNPASLFRPAPLAARFCWRPPCAHRSGPQHSRVRCSAPLAGAGPAISRIMPVSPVTRPRFRRLTKPRIIEANAIAETIHVILPLSPRVPCPATGPLAKLAIISSVRVVVCPSPPHVRFR